MIASAAGQLGDGETAAKAAGDLVKFRPELPALMPRQVAKVWNPEFGERFLDGLRKAGLDIPAAQTPSAPASTTSGAVRSADSKTPSIDYPQAPNEDKLCDAVRPRNWRA